MYLSLDSGVSFEFSYITGVIIDVFKLHSFQKLVNSGSMYLREIS